MPALLPAATVATVALDGALLAVVVVTEVVLLAELAVLVGRFDWSAVTTLVWLSELALVAWASLATELVVG